MSSPVTLITGASSGIGEALAREFASRGHRVVLLGRRVDRLEALARELGPRTEAFARKCDVSVDGEIDAAVKDTLARLGRLDVAIANAGISSDGPFEKITIDDHRRVFETNYFGVLRTAYACYPALRESRGRFAALGSVSGFLTAPGLSAYNASKFAVRGLLGTLEIEWARSGVAVTHIAPGFVESEIRTKDGRGRAMKDPVPRWLVMPAKKAARDIADAIDARRPEVVVTGHGKALVQIARHAPRAIATVLRAASSRAPGFRKG